MAATSKRGLSPALERVMGLLEDVAHYNLHCAIAAGMPPLDRPMSPFHSARVPGVSLVDYAARIQKYARTDDNTLLIAACLVLRFQAAGVVKFANASDADRPAAPIVLCPLNLHRLFLTASMVAAKTYSDVFYSNAYYAQVGGVGGAETPHLETAFLLALNWHVFVAKAELEATVEAAAMAWEVHSHASATAHVAMLDASDAVAATLARHAPKMLTLAFCRPATTKEAQLYTAVVVGRRVAALCGVGCVPLTRDGDAGAVAPFVAAFGIVKPPKTFAALLAEDVEKREEKLRARSSPLRAAAPAFIPTVRRPSVGSAIGGGSPLSMSNNEKLGFTFPGASSAISLCDDGPAVEAHTPGRQFLPGSCSASNASSGYLANRHIRRGTTDSSASAVPSPGGCSPAIESRVA